MFGMRVIECNGSSRLCYYLMITSTVSQSPVETKEIDASSQMVSSYRRLTSVYAS